MSEEFYRSWLERIIPDYAADHVRAGGWDPAEALQKSQEAFQAALPDGLATPGHELWTIRDDSGADVGVLWVALDTPRPGHAFIYDIEIDESRRGQGFGAAALDALDAWARANGITAIGLHVFGFNAVARRLYQRQGYLETDLMMVKQL
jgi:RimJ/RimL family protein N-acetyltransferase